MSEPEIIVKVLGTAQDGGIPQVNCTCENCLFAYQRPAWKRLVSSLAVILPEKGRWHLIDATPDLREQMALMKRDFPALALMDSVLLTHAHIGHYTGLMFLGKEVLSTHKLPVYAGEKMGMFLEHHAPWRQLVELENIRLQRLESDTSLPLEDGLHITPLEVPHRNEYSETFGFVIEGRSKRLLYIPDIDRWKLWDRDLAQVAAAMDFCVLDATFFTQDELAARGRNYSEVPHPLMSETMDLLQEVIASGKTSVYFTHLNHSNASVHPERKVRAQIERRGFALAEEGWEFRL